MHVRLWQEDSGQSLDILEHANIEGRPSAATTSCRMCSRKGRALNGQLRLRFLAASADASDLAVDISVFLIKALLRYRRRCWNIGCTRLAVAYRR